MVGCSLAWEPACPDPTCAPNFFYDQVLASRSSLPPLAQLWERGAALSRRRAQPCAVPSCVWLGLGKGLVIDGWFINVTRSLCPGVRAPRGGWGPARRGPIRALSKAWLRGRPRRCEISL